MGKKKPKKLISKKKKKVTTNKYLRKKFINFLNFNTRQQ